MPKEILGAAMGDLLKGEALTLSRVAVAAEKGTKAGQLVKYAPRGDSHYLIALTDEVNGEVVVQPWNCVIDLAAVNKADITAAKIKPKGGGADVALTVVELNSMGDLYGIAYIGAPKP